MDIEARIREILDAEAAAITAVPVSPAFARAVEAMQACTGRVLTTGMGKAGHVARKMAATLCSTALPSAFLHPGEALHGDLGLVSPGDLLLAYSNSGRTREVLEVVALGRRLGLRSRGELLAAFAAAKLHVVGRSEVRPQHPRAADPGDPLHAARAAEMTSLWRLAADVPGDGAG